MNLTTKKLKSNIPRENLLRYKEELLSENISLQMEANRMRNTTWSGYPPWERYENQIQENQTIINQINNRLEK